MPEIAEKQMVERFVKGMLTLTERADPSPRDCLKKELTSILKKYDIIKPDTTGQIMCHLNSGGVSKIVWMNLEVK